jgi:drug/metabolite transporter (DMT)-like permease
MSPILKIIIASILWGASGVYVKESDNMPAIALAFFRSLIPSLIIYTFLKSRKSPKKILRKNYKWMLFSSSLNSVRTVLFFISFAYTTIGNAQITLYSWPIWAAILAYFFLKEKLTLMQSGLLCTTFIGLIFIFSQSNFSLENQNFIGITAMALSAFLHSCSIIIFKKYGGDYKSEEIVFYQNVMTPILLFAFCLPLFAELSAKQIFIASIFGLINGTIGFSLFFSGLKQMKTASAAQITYIEPLCGIMWGFFLYKEELNLMQILGGSLILGSTFMLSSLQKKSN